MTRGQVRDWWHSLPAGRATANSHAYSLLRTIMGTAVDEERLAVNPCRIRGAGVTKRARQIEPATPEQLRTIVGAMPERWQAWCCSGPRARYGSERAPNCAAETWT